MDVGGLFRMAEDFEEHSTRALKNPEKHMSNPVNAFLAVKRFTSDWDYVVQTYIRNNSTNGMMLLSQWAYARRGCCYSNMMALHVIFGDTV